MSIITEINRLSQAKSDLKIVIENKGVSIPSNVKIDEYYKYIDLKYLPLTFEILSSGDIYFYCDGNSIQYSKNGGEWTNLTGVYNQLYTISLTVEGKSGTYTYGGYDSQNMGMCYWENGNDRVYNDGLYCYNNYVYDSSYNNYYILTCQNAIMPYTTSMTVEGKSGTYTYGGYDNNRMYMYYWENGNDRVYNNYYYVTTNDSVKDNNYNRYNVLTTQNEIIRGIPVVNGDIVQFRGNSPLCTFRCTSCEFNVYGNIMSLVNSTNFANLTTITNSEYFYNLFKDISGLLNAENLILPATTLADYCYGNMFFGCTSLTTAPSILPANTLADNCYNYMFFGCTSLTSVPALPATTLARNCYYRMFYGCTSLTTAPELPATTLVNSCYQDMFSGCTSLTTAPELPATTLSSYCYYYMFYGCSSLNYIKCLATDISPYNCTSHWLYGVSSSGTFVKAPFMSGWTTGNSGIPTGWVVEDYIVTMPSVVTYPDRVAGTIQLPSDTTGTVGVEIEGIGKIEDLSLTAGVANFYYLIEPANYSFIFTYSGDAKYPSTTVKKPIEVVRGTPDLTVELSNITAGQNESIIINGYMDGGSYAPSGPLTGSCDIYMDDNFVRNSTLTNGNAVVVITNPPVGIHNVSVRFNGNDLFNQRTVSGTFTVSF